MEEKESKLKFSTRFRKLGSIQGDYLSSPSSINYKTPKNIDTSIKTDISSKKKSFLIGKILHRKPYFIKFQSVTEPNGNLKHCIQDHSDTTNYFDIFIWENNGEIIKFDLHYDVQIKERVLSWSKNKTYFVHKTVGTESEKDLGMKKSQIQQYDIKFNWSEISRKFNLTLKETLKKLKKESESKKEIIAFLMFIYKTISETYEK